MKTKQDSISKLTGSTARDLSDREPEIAREIHLMQKATHGLREIVEVLSQRLTPVMRSAPEDNCKEEASFAPHTQLGCQLRVERGMVEHVQQELGRILELLEL